MVEAAGVQEGGRGFASKGDAIASLVFLGALCVVAASVFFIPQSAPPLTTAHVKIEASEGHGSATHIGGGVYLTAAHVAKVGNLFIGEEPATLLWSSDKYDIALVRSGDGKGVEAVALSCAVPAVGSVGYTYGNPSAVESVRSRTEVVGEVRQINDMTLVPVQGAFAPGVSGGGFIVDGELAGVAVSVSVANLGGFPSLYGVGFIVPASVVCGLMARA